MKRSRIGSSNSHPISVQSDSTDDDEPPTIPASRISTPRRNNHPNTTNQTPEAENRQATPSHTPRRRNIQDVPSSSNLDSPVYRVSNPSIQRSPTQALLLAMLTLIRAKMKTSRSYHALQSRG
ncbi:hypothetical protein M0657_011784 [Pyricularia oryzae]|nr:hypothetical protein M0657_011784 [Pyricularia oryzae]